MFSSIHVSYIAFNLGIALCILAALRCETVMPVEGGVYRRLTATTAVEEENASDVAKNLKAWNDTHSGGKRDIRKLQAWKENEKWKTTTKWQTSEKWKNTNDDEEPK